MPASTATLLIIYSTAALQREAWQALLTGQPGIQVLGAAGDLAQAAALSRLDRPVVVLLDHPPLRPEWLPQLKTALHPCSVLVLVPGYDLTHVIALLQSGAAGCISQNDSVADLCRAIIAAGREELVLPREIASRMLAALAHGVLSASSLVEPLSARETEVLRLLAQGLSNKDIAQTLILSVRTVEAYLRSLYGKLGVRSRTEAALWATRNGYGPDR